MGYYTDTIVSPAFLFGLILHCLSFCLGTSLASRRRAAGLLLPFIAAGAHPFWTDQNLGTGSVTLRTYAQTHTHGR